MKLSLNWLEQYFIDKPDWNLVWERLTAAGIEIEDIKSVGEEFSGIVVARVVDCIPHPDADKLNLCIVDAGDTNTYQIVCGAGNVTAGVVVPLAKIGAILPGGMVIGERKMRGITSYGMLCSGSELGIFDDTDGLLLLPADAQLGISVREYLDLDDKIVEFKITPNRGDCLSVCGIIREISALTEYKTNSVFDRIDVNKFGNDKNCENNICIGIASTKDKIEVENLEEKACPNYMSLVINGLNNKTQLPPRITRMLERSGVRSISPIVDLANYVMLETGQPLHAFDLEKIGSKLTIRYPGEKERLKLLDGKEVLLNQSTLIITDEQDVPVAIAGVMGGFDSGVTAGTRDIVLESAFFEPNVIAGITKFYGVNSEAASRFERGVDYTMQQDVLLYAAILIQKYCGGTIGQLNITSNLKPELKMPTIEVSLLKIQQLIGIQIPQETICQLLTRLNFVVNVLSDEIISVVAPCYRFDIKIVPDVIEEISRAYGYNNVPAIMPTAKFNFSKSSKLTSRDLKRFMVNHGFTEIISYAFIEEKLEQEMGVPSIDAISLQNPIANLNVMRTSLIADLVKTLRYNLSYGHKDIKLFELGRVFYNEAINTQPLKIAGLIHGNVTLANGLNQIKSVDFYDLKAVVEELLSGYANIEFIPCADYSVLHSGRCAKIRTGNIDLGIIGQLHPKLSQDFSLPIGPYLFELDICKIRELSTKFELNEVNKFPRVERDLAFVVDHALHVGDILSTIKSEVKLSNLVDMHIFDIYKKDDGAKLKSVAINFVFQSGRTLTDDEIKKDMELITSVICSKFKAEIRS